MDDLKNKAPVNKIIPFSTVDGPGNRVAVFLQGCDFDCRYCHNPETIHICVQCGNCVKACPGKALEVSCGQVVWNMEKCCHCDTCIQVCPHGSSPKIRMMDADDMMREIEPSLVFARGITTSGGECTRHDRFLAQLFEQVHRKGKSTFADTNGQRDFKGMPDLMETMDKAMLDVKSMKDEEHRMLTGASIDMVLSNLEYLLEKDKLFEIRTVVVPGLLDNRYTVDAASKMIGQHQNVRYKLIKFRPWGVRKDMMDVQTPSEGIMEELAHISSVNGVNDIVIV